MRWCNRCQRELPPWEMTGAHCCAECMRQYRRQLRQRRRAEALAS
jgi:hypothetical protein